jgi:hypothetical protein
LKKIYRRRTRPCAPGITRVTTGALAVAPAVTHYHRPIFTGGLWCSDNILFWCAGNTAFPSSERTPENKIPVFFVNGGGNWKHEMIDGMKLLKRSMSGIKQYGLL